MGTTLITQDLLEYANSLPAGFYSISTTGDTPNAIGVAATGYILRRTGVDTIVALYGISSGTLNVNHYNGHTWLGWLKYTTNTDLHKVTHKKNFGGFSANSMREFLIAVINKVLENNLWTSPEDVIVFCATWFGNSYGMGILASQNSNNDIIISYDSEDGNSYTMHYVPSTNTVKAFYKRQGTSLL